MAMRILYHENRTCNAFDTPPYHAVQSGGVLVLNLYSPYLLDQTVTNVAYVERGPAQRVCVPMAYHDARMHVELPLARSRTVI